MVSKKMYTLVAFLLSLSFATGELKVKGSIAFVMDDTGSMEPEIDQVIARTDDIFEAVLSSNASQIDEFIIVTFNDPEAYVREKTHRRSAFKRALRKIQADGGGDCPEMAMKGIKLALDESKPNSFLYAFTDASAKDYMEYENVKSLALEKSIQINFLLTGECGDQIEELHPVYDRLAAATSGQVLHIGKLDISKIIEYILANLRSKRTILLHKTYGYRCDLSKFTVDSKVWDILIALSAPRPLEYVDLAVYGPDGTKASILDFINSRDTIIVKLKGNPGEYTIDIGDCEDITVVVSAATSVSFRHGFSSVKPSSLDETSTKPLLGKKSYLAIALDNDERDVTLKNLEIRDMDDKLVQQLSLKIVDEENQFYRTDLFTPPEKAYKIAINGYTKSNEKITRVSETSIEYHRPEKKEERPATVTVIGPKEVLAEYNKPLMLKCKVKGFPRPQIWWLDEFDNIVKAKVNEISPNEYISILHVSKVTINVKFTCVAENFVKSSDYVSVIVEKKSLFEVLEHPKDVTVEYGEPVELNFKINANPPATIIWYQDNKIIRNNEDVIISSDASSLKIKIAKPSLEGEYYVTASNGHDTEKYEFKITVTMKEKPAKVTTLNKVFAQYNQPLTLTCKVEGYPEPSITWEDEHHNVMASTVTEKTPPYEFKSILQIDKVMDSTTYICKAKNKFNEDSGSVNVEIQNKTFFNVLEYPKDIAVEYGKSIELNFKIDAIPPATIVWYRENKEIKNNEDITVTISSDGSSLNIKSAKPSLEGEYYATASNGHDNEKYEFKITVMMKQRPAAVTILGNNKITVEYNQPLSLTCKVEGFPKPSITWEDEFHKVFPSKVHETTPYEYTNTLDIEKATESVTYICKAKNILNEDSVSVEVFTKKRKFFNVLDYPKDVAVEYGKSAELNFKIDAFPSATIIWYQDDNEIRNNHDFQISADGSLLKIKNAEPRLESKYYVKATNGDEKVEYEFDVTVVGTEVPRIDKHVNSYTKLRESSVDINCRVIQGKPKPGISWSFDHSSLGKFTNLEETAETIHIEHVTARHVGTYKCYVSNAVGSDNHTMQLYMEYPPTVLLDPSKQDLKSQEGKEVKLACRVDGSPVPNVRWLMDELEIHNGRKYKIFQDHKGTILSFTGAITDSGSYSCEASNYLETITAKVSVSIYDPVKIETPKQTEYYRRLKSDLVLSCHVTGHPKPEVLWTYVPFGHTMQPKPIEFDKDNNNVILKNIRMEDEGFYCCIASNRNGRDNITYEVHVPVPAMIIPEFLTYELQLVKGDLYFELPCITAGSPKPSVTWRINGNKIGLDRNCEILSDGTLTCRNVTLSHKGTYSCTAENQNGTDRMEYEVDVHESPIIEGPIQLIPIIEGEKKHNIYCGKPLEEGSLVRWFKDRQLIQTGGDITLVDVTKADAGYYTCRYSRPQGASDSVHNQAIVGTKPKFINKVNSAVTFKAGAKAHLDCSASGEPSPTTKWWFDNKQTNVNTTQYTFTMNTDNIGLYMCSVSNELDSIKRYFDIISGECLMDLKKDFTAQQPLLVFGNRKRQCPTFNITGGSLRMKKLRKFTLFCPNSFISYNNQNYGRSIETSCLGDSMFDLKGRPVRASEITCDKPIIPIEKNILNRNCLGSNTELLNIGFDVDGSPVCSAFSVCFNKTTKTPIFAKHSMHKAIANTIPVHVAGYTRGTRSSFEFEDIYDCRNQVEAISSFTGKPLKTVEDEKCCFKKLQLVNTKDVLPGICQVATYHYLNIVPQWSTCGTENWDEVERRVRRYALNLDRTISIWTGAASIDQSTFLLINKNVAPIILKDKLNQELQVPQFIWKVVERKFAIIHINVPGLTSAQASSYTLCTDICESVKWMRSTEWHNVDKGFIYCCTIKEFENAFKYGIFL